LNYVLIAFFPEILELSMSSYKELLAQREKLERQLEETRLAELERVVAEIKDSIATYQLSPLDLGYTRKELLAAASGKGPKPQIANKAGLPPKYRNPTTGQTWSGRGRMPLWMTPDTAEQFAV
jgi:DNA-binding protein H-NS